MKCILGSHRLSVVAHYDKLRPRCISSVLYDLAHSAGRRINGVYAEVCAVLDVLGVQDWQHTAQQSQSLAPPSSRISLNTGRVSPCFSPPLCESTENNRISSSAYVIAKPGLRPSICLLELSK